MGTSAALRTGCRHRFVSTEALISLQIAKWGNSLALRIPADVASQFDLHAGDTVDARLTADGALSIRQASWNRAVFAAENERARKLMPMGTAVINEMRHKSRY